MLTTRQKILKGKWPAVTVKIFGEDYRLKGVREPEYIEKLAEFLNKKMKEVAANTQLTSTTKIAILAALNISDELFHYKERQKATQHQIKERIENLVKLIDTHK